MARPNPEEPTLFELSVEEAKAIGRQGLAHPSTKPVITGGIVGGVAAAILPVVTWPIGLAAGAVFALVMRVKR
ncbi:hypothetical protein [Sphingopyxis yananensis]|uniref:hypothetical protein n=1 Tax=Sphingopyxis yananensis TaxID=2886687 RepID=UPI001D11CC5A|nr:hypothetical protein [Sphingopyxis yananensis]MCC2603054.1 hypothetical protein [Sphingopyxis yananensis]